ncbi:ArgP/LysG family DNA-binding transcriptional regulator [Cellulomonas wangsupingiae]|uniref:ArgP/LysG family DNA-binding transcriptional regulator n=1 Tax=Cellulomonas wangsupingiae TaxID=2968085 RepID=A0ABY5K3H2_9CELL|nr:ArgP/LysG family DNA-binding transcriptional regulator [Cellulomonas wangsupingiae]MCC2333749.1 ArgP/LysG family DNA-binding transcriptional regulator [Cellulomonas wangsupingiae]MCM0639432.1 ArgP/LysG family DNA-binding transcriptional regulator [Cellulomonas wangsupingiae]UUI65011.1 ArgP/LysG family DNA-binding transcriptional regulator [Cellulomonas wangsupingiae]
MTDWDLGQLRALAAAADLGTFDAAARALHVTPSAVSQRIKALEQTAGAVLLRRDRPVRPTAAGEPLVRLARQLDTLTADATRHLTGETAVPHVTLAVNGDSLTTWVLPALAPLAGSVALRMVREDQDRSADLLRDGSVMGAVTSQAVAVQGCTVEPLGVMRYRPMATPEFADRWFAGARGDAIRPAALAVAPVVVFDAADRLQDRWLRRRRVDPARPPRHLVPASADFAAAVRLGFGWGMLPGGQADDDERAGRLVRLTDDAVDVPLHWQQWSLRTEALDAVAAALRTAAAATLRPPL